MRRIIRNYVIRIDKLRYLRMALGNTCSLGFFQLSLRIDYRRLDWCSLPLICSAHRPWACDPSCWLWVRWFAGPWRSEWWPGELGWWLLVAPRLADLSLCVCVCVHVSIHVCACMCVCVYVCTVQVCIKVIQQEVLQSRVGNLTLATWTNLTWPAMPLALRLPPYTPPPAILPTHQTGWWTGCFYFRQWRVHHRRRWERWVWVSPRWQRGPLRPTQPQQ